MEGPKPLLNVSFGIRHTLDSCDFALLKIAGITLSSNFLIKQFLIACLFIYIRLFDTQSVVAHALNISSFETGK